MTEEKEPFPTRNLGRVIVNGKTYIMDAMDFLKFLAAGGKVEGAEPLPKKEGE